jgi:RHS repeat-associated protein
MKNNFNYQFVSRMFLLLAMVQVAFSNTTTAPERGFNPGKSYAISDIETISVQSGNLMLNLPLASLAAGRGGLSAGLSLHYNSKLWNESSGEAPISGTLTGLNPSDDGGWKYGYLYQIKLQDSDVNSDPFVVMPDGSQHKLCVMDVNGNPDCKFTTYSNNTYVDYFTMDGTYLKLRVLGNVGGDPMSMTWTLSMPDGSQIINKPATGIAQRTIDRNGNYIDIVENASDSNYSSHKTTYIQDQLGRKIVIEYSKATDEDWVRFEGFGGEDTVTRVKWATINVKKRYHACMAGCQPVQSWIYNVDQDFRMVDTVYLAAPVSDLTKFGELSYAFDYNDDIVSGSNPLATVGWGEVKQVTLPSGAYSTYNYSSDNATGPTYNPLAVTHNRPTQKQLHYTESYDGSSVAKTDTWTYGGTTCANNVCGYTITAPDGGVTTQYYGPMAGHNPELGDVLLKSVNADGSMVEKYYDVNHPIAPIPNIDSTPNNYAKYEYRTIADANGNPTKTAIKEFSQDKNGNTTEVKEYDFVDYSTIPRDSVGRPTGQPSGISNSLKRISKTDYYNDTPNSASTTYNDPDSYHLASSPQTRASVKSNEIQDNGNNPKSRTEMFYDSASTTANVTSTKAWNSTKGAYSSSLSSANSISTSATYDSYGNPTVTTDARGVQTTITYGSINGYSGFYPTQVETASNYSTLKRTATTTYDFYTGLAITSTDVDNGLTNKTEYDDLGRPTKAISAYNDSTYESWTTTEYHDHDRFVVVRSDLETKGDGKKVATQFYDQLGRVRLSKTLEDAATQSATNETDGIKTQTRYQYHSGSPSSSNGTYTLTSNPYRAATSSAASNEPTIGWSVEFESKSGNLETTETFAGTSLPSLWGNNTNSTGKSEEIEDANSTTTTDEAGKKRRTVTDALGRLIRVDEPDSSGNLGLATAPVQATNYSYDPLGNLTQIVQGGQTRTFTYSSLSRLLSAINPESGLFQFTYDASGNLLTKTDARNISTTFTYDALNRATFRNYSDSTPDVTYTYDDNGVPFSKGKLTKVSSAVSESLITAYDAQERITGSQQRTDGQTYSFGYTYNLDDDLLTQTYPSGKVIEFNYDSSGDLSRVGKQSGFTYANSFSYAPHGQIEKLRLGNGRWETTQFNSRRQITQIGLGYSDSNTGFWKTNYEYGDWNGTTLDTQKNNNSLARQTITVPTIAPATGFTAIQTYNYDSLDRIKSATETIGGGQTWKQAFNYDRFGNRNFDTNNTTILSNESNIAKITNPEILTSNNKFKADQDNDGQPDYLYDLSGNLTKNAQGRDFTFNAENLQTTAAGNGLSMVYSYDGNNKRVKSYNAVTGQTTIFVYDAEGDLAAEYTINVPPPTTPVISYHTEDALGSVRVVTNSFGEIKSRRDFLPFGEELYAGLASRNTNQKYSSNTDDTRKKFATYQRDAETGLDFAQSRYYSPMHGRFTSPDEFKGGPDELFDFEDDASSNPTFYADLTNPQSLNKYQYGYNNPYKFNDPTGHCPPAIGIAIAVACYILMNPTPIGPREPQTTGEAVADVLGVVPIPGSKYVGGILGKILLGGAKTAAKTALKQTAKQTIKETVKQTIKQVVKQTPKTATKLTTTQSKKAISTLGKRISEHKQKLADYKKNPLSGDNKGTLKNASPEHRQKIIDGRVRKLEREIKKLENEKNKLQ